MGAAMDANPIPAVASPIKPLIAITNVLTPVITALFHLNGDNGSELPGSYLWLFCERNRNHKERHRPSCNRGP